MAAIARAFWLASLTSVRLLSIEASLLALLGVLLLGGQTSVNSWLPDCLQWFALSPTPGSQSNEDTTLCYEFWLPRRRPRQPLNRVYTPHSKGTQISFLLVWYPTSWMADSSLSGSSFSNPCQQSSADHMSFCLFPPLLSRHAETSHGASQGDGGYPNPTWPAPQGRVQHPSIILLLRLTGSCFPSCLPFGSKGLVKSFASIFLH